MGLARFFRTVVQVRSENEVVGDFHKLADRNETIWRLLHLGRWSVSLATYYEGDRYGYIGSDTTSVRLRVTRNPESCR